jgi:hypothetical protein
VALALICLLGVATAVRGHEGHAGGNQPPAPAGKNEAPDLEKIWARMLAPRDALTVAAAFDGHGRLWIARVRQGHVEVLYSDDRGRSFGAPVRVNAQPQHIGAHGDARPKIVIAGDGTVYVAWTENLPSPPFASHVRLAHSRDGGKTFSPPVTLNDDPRGVAHAFAELGVDAKGRVWSAWLDRRGHADATAKGERYVGTGLYFALSDNGGRDFTTNRKAVDGVCECCRLGFALDDGEAPVVMWRHIFDGGVRDHALMRLADDSKPRRVTHDEWKVDGCPHHGPSLAIGADGSYHFAWFAGAADRPGLYYRRTSEGAARLESPMAIGDPRRQPAHPQVIVVGRRVVLAWKEFDGSATQVRVMTSADGGRSWAPPREAARSGERSDHPLLITDGERVYLSWNTTQEGYRLIEIAEP